MMSVFTELLDLNFCCNKSYPVGSNIYVLDFLILQQGDVEALMMILFVQVDLPAVKGYRLCSDSSVVFL